MICGTVNGVSGLSIGIVAVAIFSTLAWVMIKTPTKVIAFRQRYDTWLTAKIPVLGIILSPQHRLESRLTRLGAGASVVRAGGVVAGLLAVFLLVLLLIALINPCPQDAFVRSHLGP